MPHNQMQRRRKEQRKRGIRFQREEGRERFRRGSAWREGLGSLMLQEERVTIVSVPAGR